MVSGIVGGSNTSIAPKELELSSVGSTKEVSLPYGETSLHIAMRKKQFDEAYKLVQDGADLSKKDSNGFTVIDYAVFDNQIKQLSQLFLQDRDTKDIKPQFSEELESVVNSEALVVLEEYVSGEKNEESVLLKDYISKFSIDKLSDKKSEEHQSFVFFLNKTSELKLGSLGSRVVHLLALFAQPEVLNLALELNPEWANLTDNQGNTPLHYASQNTNEKMFVELLKAGANIFTMNIKGETPLGLLVYRIQQLDPLAWDKRDVFIFLASWLPTALKAVGFGELAPLTLLGLNVASFFPSLSLLLGEFNSNPKKVLFLFALLGTRFIPILNLPVQAYSTYCFVSRAFDGLKAAWQHLYHRPLKAISLAAVRSSNAVDVATSFYRDINIARLVWRVGSVFGQFTEGYDSFLKSTQEKCGEEPEMVTWISPNPAYPKYVECKLDQFSASYSNILEQEPFLNDFYQRASRPFAAAFSKSCPQATINAGEGGFQNCINVHLNEYILKYFDVSAGDSLDCSSYTSPPNLNSLSLEKRIEAVTMPKCLQGALDIIKQGSICDANPHKTYLRLSKLIHPDHHKDEKDFYGSLMQKLIDADSILTKEYKAKCR